jgi:acyl-CoA dehydrogenase
VSPVRYLDRSRATVAAAADLAALAERMRRLAPAADAAGAIPDGLFDGIDVRWLNRAYLPLELGGDPAFADGVTRCLATETLGYADASLTVALPGPSLSLSPLLELGTEEQRRDLLGRFDSPDPVWGAFAITEPSGGSDATHLATTASREDGGYRLAGEKCFIGNAGRASFVVVFASVDPSRGRLGIQPLVVDRDAPGLTVDDTAPMLGLRALRVARLRFEDCWVPEERLLGAASGRTSARAFLSAQRSWDYMRPALSSLMLGAVERLLDDLRELGDDAGDAVVRRSAAALADRVRPRLASARLLAHHAAATFDAGDDASVLSSMAKTAAAGLARATVAEAVAAVGVAGLGAHRIARDVERWARDFQAFELLEGTTEVHQLMIARGWSAQSRRRRRSTAARGAAA